MKTLKQLFETLPQQGTVTWIGVRPARRTEMQSLEHVLATPETGLDGDRYSGRSKARQVTLLQAEHLEVIASCVGIDAIQPMLLRRNIVVKGLNLLALKDKRFAVGQAELEYTGQCHPCSRMEELLGPGGYNAVRGHGGITARIVTAGQIFVSDVVASAGPVISQ